MSLWIVHRDARARAALARLAAVDAAASGPPELGAFADAPAPELVVMGVGGDLEAELDFAHRLAGRAPGARWVLLAETRERAEAERLFDTLAATWLSWPPSGEVLRARIDAVSRRQRAEPLSARRLRAALAERFARWLGALELPDLLRALDPRLARVPLLVRGETGTGRALLARYVHVFGGSADEDWRRLDGAALDSQAALHDALATLAEAAHGEPATVCLEQADALPSAVQRELAAEIEAGVPAAGGAALRWIATAGDDASSLEPALADALAGIALRLPSLRERGDAVEIAEATAAAWCRGHGQPPIELADDARDALRDHPWPGNVRELEALVTRSLAAGARGTLAAAALRFGPSPGELAASPARLGAAGAPGAAAPAPRPAAEPDAPAAPPSEASAPAAAPPLRTPGASSMAATGEGTLRRLADSLAAELRAPLGALRRDAERLARDADAGAAERFRSDAEHEIARVEGTLDRLAELVELPPGEPERVDLTRLLEGELERRRGEIESRRLLVLKELERTHPYALGEPERMQYAVRQLVDHALASVPERGDLYVASKHHVRGSSGGPELRVLARYRHGAEAAREALAPLLAELAVEAAGGRLTVDAGAGDETVLVLDLPACTDPDPEAG